MANNSDLQFRPAEFEAIPLDFIVAAPLLAAINAVTAASLATRDFIQTIGDAQKNLTMTVVKKTGNVEENVSIQAPLLALLPIPHLRIDSLTTHFRYEITQTIEEKKSTTSGAQTEIGLPKLFSVFGKLSLTGHVTHESSSSNTTNRSGIMEITIHASQADVPKGLDKLLNLMADSIGVSPASGSAPTSSTGKP
jgi:hypothetical protein